MAANFDRRDVSFDIVEQIGVLNTHSTGWTKEINLVSWNGGAPRYDIREWDPNHERMSKGITLQENEMRALIGCLRRRAANGRKANGEAGAPAEGPDTGAGADAAAIFAAEGGFDSADRDGGS